MTIRQTQSFKCSPSRLYAVLLSSTDFAAATGAAAEIDPAEGGEFSCFDGQIEGRTVRLDENREIVQQWRVGIWPEGVYSTVRFTLEANGDETHLSLQQSGHPDDMTEHLEPGWTKMYWEPLRDWCEAEAG